MRNFTSLLLAVLVGAGAGWLILHSRRSAPPHPTPVVAGPAAPSTTSTPVEAGPLPGDLSPEEQRVIGIFREASAAVAFITSVEFRRDVFSLNVMEIPRGTGSAFVWDDEGHIVTNYHVVQGGDAFSVTLADQSDWDAKVVGVAPDKDLAVLHIEAPASALHTLPLGESKNLVVGQTVLAVGNPFGLDHSLTVGVVSALDRELRSPGGRIIRGVIQTDAAINPGNSGGPLLDSQGRLVGVNSAIYSPSGAFAGIGFAIPVDTVKRLVPQLIENGKPILPGIGVSLVPDAYVKRADLEGAAIYEVNPDLPAGKAGLKGVYRDRQGHLRFGDLITDVNGKPIESSDDLFYTFEAAGVGARVTLTVDRDGKSRKVEVTLVALE